MRELPLRSAKQQYAQYVAMVGGGILIGIGLSEIGFLHRLYDEGALPVIIRSAWLTMFIGVCGGSAAVFVAIRQASRNFIKRD